MSDERLEQWPDLGRDDDDLLRAIQTLLTFRVAGNPYSSDGSFAQELSGLPAGLRAMGATHWLDISLTLDSVTWHFGNFGEAHLVHETEAGLRELGLNDLAQCFHEAKNLVLPLLADRTEADDQFYVFLDKKGVLPIARQLNKRGRGLAKTASGKSAIYDAWVQYARQHPERVFEG